MIKKPLAGAIAFSVSVGLTGCLDSDSSGNGSGNEVNPNVPETYSFDSRFINGEESAQYPGQITRHVLIDDLNTDINTVFNERLSGQATPDWSGGQATEASVMGVLNNFYEEGTAAIGDEKILLTTDPTTQQQTYNDISSGKNLIGKTAGNDDVTDHKDWNGGGFQGWDTSADPDSPEQLIKDWFGTIAQQTVEESDGTNRVDPVTGNETLEHYHTENGLDLKQLIQKFLLGAVAFSQGSDDYLDDDVDGKGLLTDNTDQDGDAPYSALEHQWDEGYGYFGAARDYLEYSDAEIAGKSSSRDDVRADYEGGYHDSNDDGKIDLVGEFNFGNSQNAAKRDLGSESGTDFTQQAFDAFITGRAIIAEADGDLSDAEMEALKEQRDLALDAWEKSVAATVVHYINDTLADMENWENDQANGSSDYSYIDHTKHFGELKGFALGLQFNPRSPLNEDGQFAAFHNLVGEKPVLPPEGSTGTTQAEFDAYKDDLIEARGIMQQAYDFAEADVENW